MQVHDFGSRHPGGCGFLFFETSPSEVFTAEDLNQEQREIADTVSRFWVNEIEPSLKGILDRQPGLVRSLMRRAAALGLMGVSIPERYGGLELDLISTLVISEHTARDGSYMIWEGGHTTIGTLPIVYFGTDAQKQRYLPRLARLDLLAAYALTEPQAGSDALAVQTRAELAEGGFEYVLNGQKMWISNASEADLFTVFAKVDGEAFTAFLVERDTDGFRVGAEERKMGLKGSSTTPLYLNDVRVPVGNVLGEVGRGHVIAFNILNLGRLKMGASTLGAAREVLRVSIRYACARRAFGSAIADFGAIRHKLAEMAVRIFAAESVMWRTAGLIQERQGAPGWDHPDAAARKLAGVREFATECSIVKVFGSEMLDYVVDEGVQIHGGYGYHEDYAVEKAYRDSRINRIFEGTNEINRLLIVRMMLKRDSRGELPLREAVERVMNDPLDGSANDQAGQPVGPRIEPAKATALLAFGLALEAFPEGLEEQQELVMLIADILIDVYAMESTILRAAKFSDSDGPSPGRDMARVFAEDAMLRIATNARHVIGACCRSGQLERWTDTLRHLTEFPPSDLIRRRQNIALHLIEKGADAALDSGHADT